MVAGFESLGFQQWLQSIGKAEKTAKNYASAIEGSISHWAIDAGLVNTKLNLITEPSQLHPLLDPIQQLPTFQEKNTKGKGMYSAALRQYAEYLNDITGQVLRDDIEQILSNNTITATDKSALVNTRIGQGKFRSQLIEQWQGCAVTGYRDVRFLVASHIKPWSKSEDQEGLDMFNGLLLLPNLDKVFDLGYITFEESGTIRISQQLEDYRTLGIEQGMSVSVHTKHQSYLAFHRECQFRP
ncbi:HNH endonuclease [Oceanicoccus sp. KOV_DT_Chl]|uniref:HNH endonuclease n=1 Tax=Oceanicoccus sp. KOV_DT_Chl TaxID=1904639 RepID=UPI001357A899|nr:HNH endonuclease [Oceanicoccus sp. KOV_DT_Chl]